MRQWSLGRAYHRSRGGVAHSFVCQGNLSFAIAAAHSHSPPPVIPHNRHARTTRCALADILVLPHPPITGTTIRHTAVDVSLRMLLHKVARHADHASTANTQDLGSLSGWPTRDITNLLVFHARGDNPLQPPNPRNDRTIGFMPWKRLGDEEFEVLDASRLTDRSVAPEARRSLHSQRLESAPPGRTLCVVEIALGSARCRVTTTGHAVRFIHKRKCNVAYVVSYADGDFRCHRLWQAHLFLHNASRVGGRMVTYEQQNEHCV